MALSHGGFDPIREAQKEKINNCIRGVGVQGTPGFSGADLANLVNVAALKAARDKAASVSQAAVEYAKDRIMMGAERKSAYITEESRRLTAYHEGGHALVAMLTRGAMPVHKATIMPRGQALGMVMQLPDKDDKSMTRRQLNAMLDVCMGGRVAEELIFGGDDVTTGASQDLSSATRIAKAMVTQYGFSERVGPQKLAVRPPIPFAKAFATTAFSAPSACTHVARRKGLSPCLVVA